jgi:signal transduction histidine kinase
MELGALRHRQGFDEYELLKEFEIFGGIVFTFLARTAQSLDQPCEKDELLVCGHRVFRAVSLIQEAALTHYMQRVRSKLAEREERLRGFNRALTHELKNQLGAAMGAADLLDLEGLPPEEHARLLDVVRRNVRVMRGVLDNLVELSRLDTDTRQTRRVLLPKAVGEAARQLRDLAQAARVRIAVGELPHVEVSAAAVELAVSNFLSNAIKYADQKSSDRWVRVRGATVETGSGPETVVTVTDNGIGVPPEKRERLFERGFRAHIDSASVEGDGLGLSIVKDALDAIGGRVWAEFPAEGGASFSFALPARRAGESPYAD